MPVLIILRITASDLSYDCESYVFLVVNVELGDQLKKEFQCKKTLYTWKLHAKYPSSCIKSLFCPFTISRKRSNSLSRE